MKEIHFPIDLNAHDRAYIHNVYSSVIIFTFGCNNLCLLEDRSKYVCSLEEYIIILLATTISIIATTQ